jgi:hypothetical protein
VALIDLADPDPLTPDSVELVPLALDAAGLTAALAAAMEDDDIAKRYALRPFSPFPSYQIPELFHPNLMCVCLLSVNTLPSATKILQLKDQYMLSAAGLAVHSLEFKLHSGHLYAAQQQLLARWVSFGFVFTTHLELMMVSQRPHNLGGLLAWAGPAALARLALCG